MEPAAFIFELNCNGLSRNSFRKSRSIWMSIETKYLGRLDQLHRRRRDHASVAEDERKRNGLRRCYSMRELVLEFQPGGSSVGDFPTHTQNGVGDRESTRADFNLVTTGVGSEINGRILREQSSREHERNRQ